MSNSRWVLVTEKRETFAQSKIRDTILGWSTSKDPVITWTDDFAIGDTAAIAAYTRNLFGIRSDSTR